MTVLIRFVFFCFAMHIGLGYAAMFPDRPIRIIVPAPPGGGGDTLVRLLSKRLAELLGQPIVVENRAGAQLSLGTAAGARSAPDGYTVTLVVQSALAINPHMYKDTGYDVLKDFAPVSRATEQSYVLVSTPAVPAKTLKELTTLAKSEPGKLTFATSGAGPQLVGELYKQVTGTDLLHVPYKGAGPAVTALLAGDVDLMISNPTAVVPHIKAGKLRAIAMLGKERSEALPDVPSALEQGFLELSDIPEWYGFAVPTGTPEAIINTLNQAFVTTLNDPEVQRAIKASGSTASPSTPPEFARQIRFDYERWGKVVKATGMKPE